MVEADITLNISTKKGRVGRSAPEASSFSTTDEASLIGVEDQADGRVESCSPGASAAKFRRKSTGLKRRCNQEYRSVADVKKPRRTPVAGAGERVVSRKKKTTAGVISSVFSHNLAVPDLHAGQSPQISRNATDPSTSSGVVFSDHEFKRLNIHPHLVTNVERNLNGSKMTQIQQRAIPAVLSGRDCLIRSETGSGKTLSYALPIIHRLQEIEPAVDRSRGLHCLVVVPTRELAAQTLDCFQLLTRAFVRLVCGVLTGGEKTHTEKRRLRRGLTVLVATPGRLLQHISSTACLGLHRLRWLVLDEADLLLDMGYQKHVSSIIEAVTSQRSSASPGSRLQTILLSATLSKAVSQLAGLNMHEPVCISAASDSAEDQCLSTPCQLTHHVLVVPIKLRLVALVSLLLQHCHMNKLKLVVFMNTMDMVDYHHALITMCLSEYLPSTNVKLFKLHGNLTQQERSGALRQFSTCNGGALFCTDVAARGLHVPRVDWIVQYTAAGRPVDYVHRVGRTARAGAGGAAVLLLNPQETQYIDVLHRAVPSVSVTQMSLASTMQAGLCADDQPDSSVEDAATRLQLTAERLVLEDVELLMAARKAFTSLLRSYAAYPAEIRGVLCVRRMHLGHCAKALALRETPSSIGKQRGNSSVKHVHQRGNAATRRPNQSRMHKRPGQNILTNNTLSEFDSGLDKKKSTNSQHSKKKPVKKRAR